MFKWITTFFVIAIVAAVPAFATDLSAETIKLARCGFFISLGFMILFAIIGATVKRQRNDRWE